MRLVLLGAPGAGKGTQAAMLAEEFKVPHISTGDIFRNNIKNGTELGKKAKDYIDKGLLVPDEITVGIVKDRLIQKDCEKGFILDGFPRTIPQAEYLDKVLDEMDMPLDNALNIYVPDEKIIERMSGRRTCPACGASYHIIYNPTRIEGKCDNCGASLIQREDDKAETVKKRLETYNKQTEPLIDYYRAQRKLLNVSGQGKIEDINSEVLKALGVIK